MDHSDIKDDLNGGDEVAKDDFNLLDDLNEEYTSWIPSPMPLG